MKSNQASDKQADSTPENSNEDDISFAQPWKLFDDIVAEEEARTQQISNQDELPD